ncbi:unnamed protein product [Staurois parvus]|uniref:Uncharacterized protein n=1 Tax=Staurois parvus TaxID=386267 RepID=A0ABN9EFE6_9NEOB|nr:unnamed protein product [Staurois parvus]
MVIATETLLLYQSPGGSAHMQIRPHFPGPRCVRGMTCHPCHLATSPGSLNSSASSQVIGRRNCSSGEAHRWPITGKEVELGEEEPSSSTKIKEDRARERSRRKTADSQACWL